MFDGVARVVSESWCGRQHMYMSFHPFARISERRRARASSIPGFASGMDEGRFYGVEYLSPAT